MKRSATLLVALALCSGCATPPPRPGEPPPKASFIQQYSESKRLDSARSLLEKGDNAGAVKIFEAICAANPVPGVTDEALFRLALLTLRPSVERPASSHAHNLLRQLKKQYPTSPWTAQAVPLVELINSAEELKRQNKNYRSSNQTLSKENQSLNKDINDLNKSINELTKNIEQLKHLDLEIEKKTR